MIIIHLRFDGGSAVEEHDIAHIASSIVARLLAGFFLAYAEWHASLDGERKAAEKASALNAVWRCKKGEKSQLILMLSLLASRLAKRILN
ncbi:hypothetical protein WKH08_03030 [Pantoea agglomerans]|uniref:hypothetical protein n=1 Tax=Enterobacter agglomerans TaxID=549 RepID=UPI00277D2C53|nr:hypothetical protein [Pantoea agglomerans]MDQ0628886.1 hypothetical protein [Pantoea agglomerans]